MLHRASIVSACGFLVLVGGTGSAQESAKAPPDVAGLVKAGRASLDRLEKQAASWTATTSVLGGARVVAEVVSAPAMRRTVLSIEKDGRRDRLLQLIVRDGSWYASDARGSRRCRPYEAAFDLPTAYFFFERSDLLSVPEGADLGTFEKSAGGVATYRVPLPEPARQQAASSLDQYDRVSRQQPDAVNGPEAKRSIESMRDLLAKGVPTEVDLKTGLIVRVGPADRQTEIRDFRWLDKAPAGAFDVGQARWEDFTDDPTVGGTDDLLMIAHNGSWQPGAKAGDTDGRLLDLKTGRSRRIPFAGTVSQPGCFLKGRTRVAISGPDASSAGLGLYEVDLKTGQNRRLGGDLLASGITLMPALSPDGKTLFALHKGATDRLLDSRACLVDLETAEARAIGEPRDMAFPSWLPDGKGLIILDREPKDPANPLGASNHVICRIDLEGRRTRIVEGEMPVLLADDRSILFQDARTRTWRVCNLDGTDARPYAGGLAGYGFPAPAPDGKRLLMMHFRPELGPEPTVLPIGDDRGTPLVVGPGLWASPRWR